MPQPFQFAQRIAFTPADAQAILSTIPTEAGIFALRGEDPKAEPYLTRAADLRRRMTRLLAPPEGQSKRLNLRDRVHSIEYTVTGSEFESLLLLYDAAASLYGHVEARRRLRLFPPYFLRLTADHAHPRVYSTNRLSRRGLAQTYGPFPSRTAAERYCDAVLDLFKLRRCYEDLQVHAEHPGCAYGEMKKCLAPCNTACAAEDYAAEAQAVEAFFTTHGESMLAVIAAQRERASEDMDFEQAAAAHERYTRVKASAALADELVRPVPQLRAVLVQQAAPDPHNQDAQEAAVFLLEAGRISGPLRLSTLGVRAVKEQTSVGSSLFAQPLMLAAVPLGDVSVAPSESPEDRAANVLQQLANNTGAPVEPAELGDHLSLLRRWYYRPEKQRRGEIFFPNADGTWPVRRILRGAARMVLGDPKLMAATDREGAAALTAELKTRVIHEGREGVERVVPVLGQKRSRRKSTVAQLSDPPPVL